MEAKLTLKLDKYVIDKSKKYASSHGKSLSRMIEAYLRSLVQREIDQPDKDMDISSFVKSMGSGVKLAPDHDYKKEYHDFLNEKYK